MGHEGFPEMLRADMGVSLRSCDGGMSEEFLHYANIGTTAEKQGGCRVTKHVGCDVFGYSGFAGDSINQVGHTVRREGVPSYVAEKG